MVNCDIQTMCKTSSKVIELLPDKCADVNIQGGYNGNALYVASVQGHEEVVELLLGNGSGVNMQDGQHGNTLHVA